MKEILINCGFIQKKCVITENGEICDVLVEHSDGVGGVGNIYKGTVDNIVPGMQSAFIDIGLDKNAFLFASDIVGFNEKDDIRKKIKKGDTLTVQIVKEAQGVKGARVTENISLPGHRLVLMPFMSHIGISKKIDDESEKERLHIIVSSLARSNHGYIVRTDACGATEEELKQEIDYLEEQWEEICRGSKIKNSPCLLRSENGLLLTVIRDYFDDSVDRLTVNSKEDYNEIMLLAGIMTPDLLSRIEYKEGNLFYGIESKLKKLLQRRVWLDSGAYLIIDTTEALTVIDVNTGKFTGGYEFNKTIVKTNIAAAKEIARQLRLRAIGGIIVIDFIDMESDEDRENVLKALEEASQGDKIKTNICGFAQLGLVELTRKKTRLSLADSMQLPCPYCDGDGKILNEVSIIENVLEELKRISNAQPQAYAVLRLNPYILTALKKYPEVVKKFEGLKIYVREDNSMHVEDFNISMTDKLSDLDGLIRI